MQWELSKEVGKLKVAVSGGFDPLHDGHIRYFKEASKLGDELIVILTRDAQLVAKKGEAYQGYDERKAILEWGFEGKKVKATIVPNVDTNITSTESIRKYKPDIFAKGGDSWDEENLPEAEVCRELGIKVVFGVGGFDKVQSSSWITAKMRARGENA